jgi:hypothetical protein
MSPDDEIPAVERNALRERHVSSLEIFIAGCVSRRHRWSNYGALGYLQYSGERALEGHKQLARAVPARQEKAVYARRCCNSGIDFQRGNIVWLM